MRTPDPLAALTWIVGAMLLLVFGRYAVTGELDEKVLTGMGTILGGLITALATRGKKDGDDNDPPSP